MTTLTDNEKKFLSILETVSERSPWGLSIKEVVKKPEPWKVRKLVAELKSAANDQPDIMQSIIGEPGMKQLNAL